MPLSRLDNFIKNTRGDILYVNPNDLDSTDSIENQGNSLTRPFKTIQRALVEASRFSYQKGLDNDRFGKTTILLYPGEHTVDNRPGWIPSGSNSYKLRNGTTSTDFPQWDLSTNFDLSSENNALYKLNSVYGGVILPRGTSLVGLDLRKTKIRPKYVPNPSNDNIERSALFRVTGGCYLYQFSMFDGDPNGVVFKDYTTNTFVPNFSHHKLTCFEYADGATDVVIDDAFMSLTTTRTDLDMYYEKVGLVYGPSSGREIEPDYPSTGLDIQPKIDEYRIVGPTGGEVGISSIKAGDGSTATTTITVTTSSALTGADVDTAIRIAGVTASGYDGQFVISDVTSSTEFKYQVSNAPTNALPTATGSTVNLAVDTVSSSSPYIFNCSLRSVYGMCGLFADGDKADGFKSMVLAQFTGIGLQKDNSAFVKYDENSGEYQDSTYVGNENIHTDSLAVYKPAYNNYHIKCNNNAVLQIVSVFAIGYAQHFVAKSGGDQSITNSNSNFGAKSLIAQGYRRDSFSRDDVGYVTHVIPPKEITDSDTNIEFTAIDVSQTVAQAVGSSTTCHLYLYNQKNSEVAPVNVLEGYRIGAKQNDALKCLITQSGVSTSYSARIVMPNTQGTSPVTGGYEERTAEKVSLIGRSTAGINSISSSTITFTKPHQFIEGESIRFISETAQLPDGVENNKVYYAITSGIGTNQLKVAKTLNDAKNTTALTINELGGTTNVLSRVSDKNSGDIGHPIQYNSTAGQWYINVAVASTDNNLAPQVVSLGTTALGDATSRTFFTRQPDTRNLGDTVYKLRYVIPSAPTGITSARPPIDGFVLQESNDTTGATDSEVASYFSPTSVTLSNVSEQRNFRFIANATWDGTNAYYTTEVPHDLSVGSVVETLSVTSTENTSGVTSTAYNNTFTVAGISSAKCFYGPISGDPGTFSNDVDNRTTSLPRFNRKDYKNTYYLYRSQEVQKYVAGEQDGIYHLLVLNASNSPTTAPFLGENFSQSVKNLYPQTNRDTPTSDPTDAISYALPSPVGEVVVDDPQRSVTKETITKNLSDNSIGIGITNIISTWDATPVGSSHTIYTSYDHGYNRITSLSIVDAGGNYGNGTGSAETLYDAKLVAIGSSTTGEFATAMVSVGATGAITDITIMDGGSAYGVGNTMHVVGIATTTSHTVGVVSVTNIYDNAGDVIRIAGITSAITQDYNQLYRIVGIETGKTKEINVSSASTVGTALTAGLGSNLTSDAILYDTGASISISSLTYDRVSGIATVVTSDNHGLRVDNRIRIVGAANDYYNNSFVVTQNVGLTTFVMNVGVGTSAPATSGTLRAFREGFAANAGTVTDENENLGGRQVVEYDNVTTILSAAISSATATDISLTNLTALNLQIGDYLLIGDEIVRIKTTVGSNPISVFRGILGTKRTTHVDGTVVRRIRVNPVELRRNSILRASGHTFEYLGYGPGNYSTALPERQDRQLSKEEELLAQSTKQNGGVVVYTGMNSDGDFYIGNKKVSSATGQEELFDAPIPTVTGEDITATGVSIGFDVLTPQEVSVSRSLRVEGGPDNNILSEFDGPVSFSKKVTSTSPDGIEANHLFLQGDATVSRKYTVGIATPSLAGNPGDVVWNSDPDQGGYMGWVYTTGNAWRRFGNVSISTNTSTAIFDNVGVGTTTYAGVGTDITFKVGSGSSVFFVDGSGNVAIGTTSATNDAARYKLNVIGGVYATSFAGDGSALTNVPTDSRWNGVAVGYGTGVYPVNNVNVGIGTTIPNSTFSLQVGDDNAGTGKTDLYIGNRSRFIGTADFNSEVSVGGTLSGTYLNWTGDSTSRMTIGVGTFNTLKVGTGGTVITASVDTSKVGIGTTIARDTLDVEGILRIVGMRSKVGIVTSVSKVLTLDLTAAQTFTCTVNENIDKVKITNPPSEGSFFTIKFLQDSTGGFSIVSPNAPGTTGIETFYNADDDAIELMWPGGGVIPVVTTGAGKSDIYSFRTFDGGSSFYGVVGGQNFG